MKEDCKRFALSCVICTRLKADKQPLRGELSSTIREATKKMQILMVDYAGPFEDENGKTQYIILYLDCYTRWLIMDVVPTKDAQTYTDSFMSQIINRYGVPETVHTDQGTMFTSQVTKAICDNMGINLSFGLAFHPRGQGAVERVVREIRISIETVMADRRGIAFRQAVALAEATHNHCKHSSTGTSPFFMIHGSEPPTPVTMILPSEEDTETARELSEFAKRVHDEMHQRSILEATERHNARARKSRIRVGIMAYRVVWGITSKRTTGPHEVLRKDGSNSWIIRAADGERQPGGIISVPEIQLHPILKADDIRRGLPEQEVMPD